MRKSFTMPKKIDYIIYASAKNTIEYFYEDPIDTIKYNLNSMKIILEYSTKNKIEGMLYFAGEDTQKEKSFKNKMIKYNNEGNDNCISTEESYIKTKDFCEMIFLTYVRQYEISANIAKPFNVFGPSIKLEDNKEITKFIKNGIMQKDIKLSNEGKDIKCFSYITDAHIGFWNILLSNFKGQVFNIGSDKDEISLKELVKLVCNLFSNTINYSYYTDVLYLKDSPKREVINIDKARKMLGYEPKEQINNWLKRLIKFYR